MNFVGSSSGPTVSDIRDGLNQGRTRALSLLGGELDALREDLAYLSTQSPTSGNDARTKPVAYSSDVFVVHGHDTTAKTEIALLIQRPGLNPVILYERPERRAHDHREV